MSKVVIIGGGIAGMTAGILLQKAGYETEILERNSVIGGLCTGWKREGYFIDNCVHWLTGTKEGSALNELWKEIGALGKGVELYEKEMLFSSELNGETLTFWRDKEKTRAEMLKLSPQDEQEINKLIDYTELAESMTVPTEKPFDCMNILELMKLGMSMKAMSKLMKEYGKIDINELAMRFKHPLIQRAISDYMPPGYQAYAFLVSYGTVTAGNGDIPKGGSLQMALRIAKTYTDNGGVIHTNADASKILFENKTAKAVVLNNGKKINADYVVCACDTDYVFNALLPKEYMPKALKKLYAEREKYPVSSSFQVAFAVDGIYPELTGTRIFSCKELTIGKSSIEAISTLSYDYEPSFAPSGKTVLQSNIPQTEEDYKYWQGLYSDRELYNSKKTELADEIMKRIIEKYPVLNGKLRVLDVWTPMTYTRYCNCYKGAYMSFVNTKNAKNVIVSGALKGIDNVFLASQWLMGPGGLPTATAMGKFAAYRIINKK